MATGAYTGNPNIARQGARARQIAQARNVSDIADPRTYGFMQGLLGSAPDQLGYSVFDDPETKRTAQQAAEVGLVGGGLLQSIPVLGPALKGYGRLAAGQVNRAMLGEGGLLGPITPQPMYVVPPGKKFPSTYPQQTELDLAQKRAALPIEQGGLGLPAINTPMDRAKAMGFDPEVYHGTQRAPEGIMNFGGKVGYAGQTGSQANWFTTDPDRASLYSNLIRGAGNPTVYPVMTKTGKQLSEDDLSKLVSDLNLDQNLEISLYDKKLQKELKKQGIKDLEFMTGQGEEKYKIIFDPAQIRSRFAAFDPFRKDVATATAMGVALPDLLAAEPTQQYQPSGLLYPLP